MKPSTLPPLVNVCDNTFVASLITSSGKYLFINNRHPFGISPPGGHIDDQDNPDQTIRYEIREDLGLAVHELEMITHGWLDDLCDRPVRPMGKGAGHDWCIYQATTNESLKPAAVNECGAGWYSVNEIADLADRTAALAVGNLTRAEFDAEPGLAPAWVGWFVRLGILPPAYPLEAIHNLSLQR